MAPDLSRSRAILVGNARYRAESGIADIPAAGPCVEAIADLLTSDLCGWPADRIERLIDVAAPHELARRIAAAVRDVQDVLLFYYVGHGLRTPDGQLALALGDTDIGPVLIRHTAMLYESVAGLLRSGATTKLVILDCCHAELGDKANFAFQSADIAETYPVDGLYFIGASKKHEKAKFPLDGTLTYFTDALVDVVRKGIPRQPAELRLDQIFVELRRSLLQRNLPEPVESGRGGARQYPFARNAAPPVSHIDYEAEIRRLTALISALGADAGIPAEAPEAPEAPEAVPEYPPPIDAALRIACSLDDPEWRAWAVVAVAAKVAEADSELAGRLLMEAPLNWRPWAFAALAAKTARPGRAEDLISFADRLATRQLGDETELREEEEYETQLRETLLTLAAGAIGDDPERALRFIDRALRIAPDPEFGYLEIEELVALAAKVIAVSASHAAALLDQIEVFYVEHTEHPGHVLVYLAKSASAVARIDADRARRLMGRLLQAATDLPPEPEYPFAVPQSQAEIAVAGFAAGPEAARNLIEVAEWRASQVAESDRDLAFESTAEVVAVLDPERANRIICRITKPYLQATSWGLAIKAAIDAGSDHTARLIQYAEDMWTAGDGTKALAGRDLDDLAVIAPAVAGFDVGRSERMAQLITDAETRAQALAEMATEIADRDPRQAARWLGTAFALVLGGGERDSTGLSMSIATAAATVDRGLAAQAAQQVLDSAGQGSRLWELATVARELAPFAPALALRLIDAGEAHGLPPEPEGAALDWCLAAEGLVAIAMVWAGRDPESAGTLIQRGLRAEAAQVSEGFPAGAWQRWIPLVKLLADRDPEAAERLVEEFTGANRDHLLAGVVEAVAATDPQRAERIAAAITDEEQRCDALTAVAVSLVEGFRAGG